MRSVGLRALGAALTTALIGCGTAAAAVTPPSGYTATVFATGGSTLSSPDDITRLGDDIFVAYQNATTATGSGGDSTVVAYRPDGTAARSWNVSGHIDGLTADARHRRVIVTTNEDANSRLYTITPRTGHIEAYTYSPDPAVLSGGGTDAISIVDGQILISASNPSPSTPSGSTFTVPAVYRASIPEHGTTVTITPAFFDNASATDAVSGQTVTLNLSDPDSNATVPGSSPRFGGDFVLDSQGDSELVFDDVRGGGSLTRLMLSAAGGQPPQVDDVRWAGDPHGTLLVADAGANVVYAITGPFDRGQVFTSVPTGSPSLTGDLATIDLATGAVDPWATGFTSPKGLLYVSSGERRGEVRGRARRHERDHVRGSEPRAGRLRR